MAQTIAKAQKNEWQRQKLRNGVGYQSALRAASEKDRGGQDSRRECKNNRLRTHLQVFRSSGAETGRGATVSRAERDRSKAARRGDAAPRVTVVHETAPRGTAGTVLAERRFVEADESFWILYSDNLVELDVMDVLDLHARHDGPVTLGLFRTPDPRSSGIVTTAPDGRVTAFVEKPEHPVGDLANAGLYLARHSLLDELASTPMPSDGILDFGLHVFPRLVGRARAVPITGFLADVGSLERLAAAERAWQAHTNGNSRS